MLLSFISIEGRSIHKPRIISNTGAESENLKAPIHFLNEVYSVGFAVRLRMLFEFSKSNNK